MSSLNRRQVDEALAERGLDLDGFVETGRLEGKSNEELAIELREITGVPFSVRTFYRWLDRLGIPLEEKAS